MAVRQEATPKARDVTLLASDLKQFVWCPRIPYYHYVLPVERATTYKMQAGREHHDHLEDLENRRSLRRYRLDDGTRQFRVSLHSERLNLRGVLDLLITTEDALYPVEFKDAPGGAALHHRYQLAAYCLLTEDTYHRPVRTAFVYVIPQKRIVPMALTDGIRRRTNDLMREIRAMIAAERMPPATRRPARCRDCEYRNYCADWM